MKWDNHKTKEIVGMIFEILVITFGIFISMGLAYILCYVFLHI